MEEWPGAGCHTLAGRARDAGLTAACAGYGQRCVMGHSVQLGLRAKQTTRPCRWITWQKRTLAA